MNIILGVTTIGAPTITYQGDAGNPNVKIPTLTTNTNIRTAPLPKKTDQQTAVNQQTADILNYTYGQANMIQSLLGPIPEPARSYGIYAVYHETAAFTSQLYKQHNNASGIMYAGQPGATKGSNGYAWFATWQDWANAYIKLLKKQPGYPAGAGSLEDFAHRLKINGYYTDSESNYIAGMKRARYVLKELPATMRAGDQGGGVFQDKQDLDIPGSTDYSKSDGFTDWLKGLKPWQQGGLIIGTGLIILVAVKS